MIRITNILISVSLVLILSSIAWADTIYVRAATPLGDSGTSWAYAYNFLQDDKDAGGEYEQG